jgi:beta-N-acetylhexosaminidase
VQAGIDGMLVGHIAVPRVTGDDRLSSLSPKVTGGILRQQMGFAGLVITDAMNMGALTRRYDEREAAILAIEAGADILLQPDDIPGTLDAVVRAVEQGRLPRARIDESVRRILAAKSRVGLQRRATVDMDRVARVVGRPEHRRLAEEVAARSITLARDSKNLVPLAAEAKRVLSITYSDGGSDAGRAFGSALAGGGRTVDAARVDAGTSQAAYAQLRARADAADVVVVSAYVTPREYRGNVETGGGFAAFVEGLARDGKAVVVVSFGSPYLVQGFPSIPAYLLAWGRDPVSQVAAARALLGRAPISGRLPVTLPGAPRGSGLSRNAAPAGAR